MPMLTMVHFGTEGCQGSPSTRPGYTPSKVGRQVSLSAVTGPPRGPSATGGAMERRAIVADALEWCFFASVLSARSDTKPRPGHVPSVRKVDSDAYGVVTLTQKSKEAQRPTPAGEGCRNPKAPQPTNSRARSQAPVGRHQRHVDQGMKYGSIIAYRTLKTSKRNTCNYESETRPHHKLTGCQSVLIMIN